MQLKKTPPLSLLKLIESTFFLTQIDSLVLVTSPLRVHLLSSIDSHILRDHHCSTKKYYSAFHDFLFHLNRVPRSEETLEKQNLSDSIDKVRPPPHHHHYKVRSIPIFSGLSLNIVNLTTQHTATKRSILRYQEHFSAQSQSSLV